LSLDKIKIDRGFIRNIATQENARNIVKTVIDLCRNLKFDCVVEGVETAEQVEISSTVSVARRCRDISLRSRCHRATSRASSLATACRIIRDWPPRPGEIRSTPDVVAPLPHSAAESHRNMMATTCH
jgi:hypothetical protein